jgi:response regulator RpfG family c-di-GMP phosphodiesterase
VQLLYQCLATQQNIYLPNICVIYFAWNHGNKSDERLFYFSGAFNLSDIDKNLMNLYIKQASISFDNLMLYNKVEKGQQEIVNLLGSSIETRSKETGNHIKRVAEFSEILAKHLNINDDEIEIIKLASPLHDLGKIGIPDAILNKAGKLDAEEWQVMMTHAKIGYDMLVHSDCEILQAGSIIAHEHHEKWDGSGYPEQKQGEGIHIYGRIIAVADVFDALASERCYKKAWPMVDIIALFKEQSGHHFEPKLVKILLENIDQFIDILDKYQD